MTSLHACHVQYTSHNSNRLSKLSDHIKAPESDDLDMDAFESWVHAIMLNTHVDDGFCGPCRYLLDNLSSACDIGEQHMRENGKWIEHVSLPVTPVIGRYCKTAEIEASTRMGCKFCAYLFQRLKEYGLLTIFRKIEWRLHQLGETSACALLIFPIENAYNIQLNLPNKISSTSSGGCQVGIYCMSRNSSAAVSAEFSEVSRY